MSDGCLKIGLVTAFVLTIVSCFLLGYSFNTAEPNEWALKYDMQTRQIESGTLYRGGRVFTGLGKEFIKFPATRQLMVFASDSYSKTIGDSDHVSVNKFPNLFVRSKDGLILDVSVTVTFKVSMDGTYNSIMQMYSKTGADGYIGVLKDIVQDCVRNVAGKFEATKFYENRDQFNLEVKKELSVYMQDINVQLYNFQMTNIDFPSAIEGRSRRPRSKSKRNSKRRTTARRS